MEATVWADPRVLNRLQHDYVLIQLYVDDKTELPLAEQAVSEYSGKKLITIGNKWSDFQAALFNTNSQPWYVLLDNDGRLLNTPQGAEYNAENFKGFLDNGLKEFNNE
jgi:thiol:disulfide interchange protein DsbD